MVGHEGSSAGSYLADPTSPIPSHSASIVATSTLRVKRVAAVPSRHTIKRHIYCGAESAATGNNFIAMADKLIIITAYAWLVTGEA